MIGTVNASIGLLVDLLLRPLSSWPPLASLTVVSLFVAAALLAVVRATVDRRSVAAAKKQIQAGLFELRLFRDDPRTVLRVTVDLMSHQAAYVRCLLAPALWVAAPLALLVAQLHAYYGYDGVHSGQSVIVKARLAAANQRETERRRPALALQVPDGLNADTPDIWAPSLREVAWRVSAIREGDYVVQIHSGGAPLAKALTVSSLVVRRSAVRPAATWLAQLRHPVESPLPAGSAIDAIEVVYPARVIPVLRYRLHWLVIFIVLTTVFMLLGGSAFRVVW
jgi:hypothetical protein